VNNDASQVASSKRRPLVGREYLANTLPVILSLHSPSTRLLDAAPANSPYNHRPPR